MSPRERLVAALRTSAFPSASPVPRIGVEVELIPVDAGDHAVVGVAERLLPFLREHALRNAWKECSSPKGAPRFALPGGGALSLEPGGQIEYSGPPFRTPRALLADLRRVLHPLVEEAMCAGIQLLGTGIDPCNPLARAPLQIASDRYRRMDAYFSHIGPFGARMMRQTASVQLNIDAATDPLATWRVLNAAAPVLTALFANSARYAGVDTGHASYRAYCWRRLDPARTGMFRCGEDAVEEYAAFALAAPVLLLPAAEGAPPSLGACLAEGYQPALVSEHLSTLFPEVRPRGYFEVRSIDGLPPGACAAPVLLLAGIAHDARALGEAAELLGAPEPERLARAGCRGLDDDRLAGFAQELCGIALAACERRGDSFCDAHDLTEARTFFDARIRRRAGPVRRPRPASRPARSSAPSAS